MNGEKLRENLRDDVLVVQFTFHKYPFSFQIRRGSVNWFVLFSDLSRLSVIGPEKQQLTLQF